MARRVDCHRSGFSLMELLAVVVVILLLAALSIPAVSGIRTSQQLSKAAATLQDHLLLARQMAITRNVPVTVSLCVNEEEDGEADGNAGNLLVLSAPGPNGDPEILERPVRLPDGFAVSGNPGWSSLMNIAEEKVMLPSGREVDGRSIRFKPSGAADLAVSDRWFFTIHNHWKTDDPDANFVTLVLDPATGRVFAYQP